MKQRLADPTDVIDLSGAADLRGINISGDQVTIGAMVTHAEVAGHAALAALCPSISQLAANIGDPSVRHRPTQYRREGADRNARHVARSRLRSLSRLSRRAAAIVCQGVPEDRQGPRDDDCDKTELS